MKTLAPRRPLSASVCSLFVYGAAVFGVCLWCRPGALPPNLKEYVTVIAVEATAEFAAEPAFSPAGTPAPAPIAEAVELHQGEKLPEAAPRQRISGPAKKRRRSAMENKVEKLAKVDDRNGAALSEDPARDVEQQQQQTASGGSFSSDVPADGGELEEPAADHGPAGPATDTQAAGPNLNATAGGGEAAGHAAASLQRNYDYIREIVMRNLSFPAWAKKMRLTGATEVSFIVGMDGEVADIRIEKSSGHELLDMNVVAAVEKSAPFPASPDKARIALPVAFRLK